ncbi:MAG: MbtH family NRPS accessory protein [Candidatus Promineifilaceae bacterium]
MGDEGMWSVINHEEQYSIWPANKAVPHGWEKVGVEGDRKRCMLYFIEKVWTDMKPVVINPFNG